MTTTTSSTTRRSRTHAIHEPRPSQRLALDPYRVEDTAWTREEILSARGYLTSPAGAHRRRPSGGRDR